MRKLIFLFLFFLLLIQIRASDTVYVSMDGIPFTNVVNHQTWETATHDLMTAIDSLYAHGGGQVWVRSGFYFPAKGTHRDSSFHLRNNVRVYGGFCGTESTIEERILTDRNENDIIEPWEFLCESILSGDIGVQGDSLDNVYLVLDGRGTDTTAVIDGFRITEGYNNVIGNLEGPGGASHCYLNNCVIEKNFGYIGGGLDSCFASNSLIKNNKSSNGGGAIYSFLDSCIITMNEAYYGGGLFKGEVHNSIIDLNNADCYGGGICNVNAYNCIITNNNTDNGWGGGLSVSGNFHEELYEAVNCTIMNNRGWGSGIGAYGYRLYNCFVVNHEGTALHHGSAYNCLIVNNGSSSSNTDLYSCTVANHSSPTGRGDYNNTIFWNTELESDNTFTSYSASNQTNFLSNEGTNGNILLPDSNQAGIRFTSPADSIGSVNTEEGLNHVLSADWSLQETSVCINKGSNSYITDLGYYDFAGNIRVTDDVIDIGAYEFQPDTTSEESPVINLINVEQKHTFNVYPTVTQSNVTIKSPNSDMLYNLKVVGITGLLLNDIPNMRGDCIIDLSPMKNNFYLILIQTKERSPEIFRIIKN